MAFQLDPARLRQIEKKFITFLLEREQILLWCGMVLFIVVFSAIGAWKLWSFGYNGFDLAIHRQVFEHSLRGDWFGFSFHPNKYLGDHFSIISVFLWPLYALWKNPLTLIILQNVGLAIVAWPLAKIAARLVGQPWHLLFVLAYLVNPFIQNMALFEFHLLPFAILILTLAILAYQRKNYWQFTLLLLLCLLVREDASLPVIGFGLLALVERRQWRWWLMPIAAGLGWLWFATKMTTVFGGYDDYKFLYYYGWLGHSFGEIFQTVVTKPWLVVAHIFQSSVVSLVFVFLLPFAFLPTFRGRWLIPAIPTIAQLLLISGAGTLLVEIYYPALIMPFFFVAAIAAWAAIQKSGPDLIGVLRRNRGATVTVILAIIIYSSLALGPVIKSLPILATTQKIADRVRAERVMVNYLPPGAVVASMETLADVSNRPHVYSLHYAFLGHRQFSSQPYSIPDDAPVVILDQRDFLFYQLLYPPDTADHKTGYRRLRELLTERGFRVTATLDRFAVLIKQPGRSRLSALYTNSPATGHHGKKSTHDQIDFLGWNTSTGRLATSDATFFSQRFRSLPINLTFSKTSPEQKLYQVKFEFRQHDTVVYQLIMPLGGGVYPTSDWPSGEIVSSHYSLLVPSWLAGATNVSVRVVDLAGGLGLNGVRSTIPMYTTFKTVGPVIELGQVNL